MTWSVLKKGSWMAVKIMYLQLIYFYYSRIDSHYNPNLLSYLKHHGCPLFCKLQVYHGVTHNF